MIFKPSLTIATNVVPRYERLARGIQQLPPAGSRPLTVSARVAGWITPGATRAVRGMPGVRVEPEAVHVAAASRPRRPLARVLEDIALRLRHAGCLKGWRNELLDVMAEGRRLSSIERAAIRPLGMLTKAVHLNAWTPEGKLWVARRAADKLTDPGKWDTLVGGLSCAGEDLATTLMRESAEEAGLSRDDLAKAGPLELILRMHRRLPEGYQVEDVFVSDCVLPESVQPRNQDGEVSEIRALALDEVWAMMTAGDFTVEAELVILHVLRRRLEAAGPSSH